MTRKKSKDARGEWGGEVRKRLERLRRAKELNQAGFAKQCGVEAPRVSDWWSGRTLPSSENWRAITDAFGVSLDWLFSGVGWDNQPVDEPVYRGRRHTDAGLEAELAAYVLFTLRERGVDLGTTTARDINGKQLLADAVRSVASYAERLRATVDATTTAALERVAAKALADDPSPARRAEVREFLANTPPAAPKIQGLLTRPHYLNGAGLVNDPRAQGVARRTTQT